MRFALLAMVVLAGAGCSSTRYGDAGADAPPLMLTNYDVSATADGGTPPVCPGELYGRASQRQATCTRPPEVCVSDNTATSFVECTCNGTGDEGVWECHTAQR